MVHDVIATCPVCTDELTITRLHCRSCGTALEGEFGVGRFGRLDRDQMRLLESFLRSRGNLKEMERELGISYPTVRGRVDGLVRALGLSDGADDEGDADDAELEMTQTAVDTAAERRDILERLARKEIDADEAAVRLRGLAGGPGG
ncbi:MAG TPA: DUF2089 domain-containing protein [Candidatus Limnocylindrales bacterium]|jgi:hypothetical protein|nr:DUF2089 domain-containing protein [Candidatus Limnocylindrales bacterium]